MVFRIAHDVEAEERYSSVANAEMGGGSVGEIAVNHTEKVRSFSYVQAEATSKL